MNPFLSKDQRWAILADGDTVPEPAAALFDAEAWQAAGAVTGTFTQIKGLPAQGPLPFQVIYDPTRVILNLHETITRY